MSGARIQLVRGLHALPVGARNTSAITWRLLGGNQRELGRSARSYADPHLAREAVVSLQAVVDRLVASPVIDPVSGRWTWRLTVEGEPVVISSRGFQRRRESDGNLRCALDALPSAVVVTEVLDLPRHRAGRRAAVLRTLPVHRPGSLCS